MTGANAAFPPGKLEFDRIEGELDAAMVFAAAAEFESQDGNSDVAAACVSDATISYAKALVGFYKADLTATQIHDIKIKFSRLEQLLKRLRQPRTHEAV